MLSHKGVLYAKIQVQKDVVVHVFTTHTQATYFGKEIRDFTESVDTRRVQIRTIRRFIEEKTRNAKENEMILMCGDLNVNGCKSDR